MGDTRADEIVTPLESSDTKDIQQSEYSKTPRPAYATASIKTWPVSILFIMANEFCERFSPNLIFLY